MSSDANPAAPEPSTGREALHRFAPAAAAVFDELVRTAPVTPHLAGVIRDACADSLGLPALPGGGGATPGLEATGTDRAIVELARQFSTDVSAVDPSLRERFALAAGDRAFGVVQAVYVADMAPRVTAVLDRVLGPSGVWFDGAPVEVDAATSWATIEELLRVVHNLGGIDPVLSELVRLSGARQHDCRLCKSLRSRPALAAGATEDLFDSIDGDGRDDLPERSRTALDLVDAIIWYPARLTDALVDAVRRDFAPAETVELVLDVMRNASNKIAVALGADAAHVTDGVEVYEIGEDGVAHYGLDAPARS